MDLKLELIRGATRVSIAAIAGAALQPIIARPMVAELAERFAVGTVVIAGASVMVLIAGRAAHQLQRWGRLLPPAEPTAMSQFGLTVSTVETSSGKQRRLVESMARLDHDYQAATERDERLRVLIVRYAFLGSQFSGSRFSWRWMCKWMGRRDWTNCLNTMTRMGALRPARGNEPPAWASGWYYSRFRIEVQFQSLAVPYPESEPLPEFRRVY